MSKEARKTRLIFETIQKLVADGCTSFRPGHVADALRQTTSPMLTYEIRGEFAKLEQEGLIAADATTGTYRLVPAKHQGSRKAG